MTITFALVATGAMGAAIGQRLVENGARVVTALDGRSDASISRAKAAGIETVPTDALVEAGVFLSIVPPNEALPLAKRIGAAAKAKGRTLPYLDLNAKSPALAHDIAATLAGYGPAMVDGTIIGAPPKTGTPGPTVYLAGPVGESIDVLRKFGLNAIFVEGGIGAAAALKMSYAAITKGLTALCAASLLAADRAGATDALFAELSASQPALLAYLRRAIPDMLPKAYRWDPEMREITAYIGNPALGGAIYEGAAELYRTIAADLRDNGELADILRNAVADKS